MSNNANRVNNPMTVSYTHLDVYKRQKISTSSISKIEENGPIDPANSLPAAFKAPIYWFLVLSE